jgi:glycosyltransferase involved in cell wall biosynthesis
MMAGTPVVASDSPSIRECLGSDTNGFLVPAGDTVALGAALVYVMNHREEAQRMGLSAADVARKKYDLAQKAAETCRAFRVSVDQAQMVRVPNRYKRSGPG